MVKASYSDLERAECGDKAAKRRLRAAWKASKSGLSYEAWEAREFPTLNELPLLPPASAFER